MRVQMCRLINNCHKCRISKKTRRNYGILPPKKVHCKTWEEEHADFIGPNAVTQTEPKTVK